MDFTFGIITGGGNDEFINQIIDSIEKENIPNYEVIIVGTTRVNRDNTRIIPFNEMLRSKWITRKKNFITQNAKYDNIVYLHDYIRLEEGWYKGQLKAGNDFSVRMDRIININGERFRDWCIWPHNDNFMDKLVDRDCLLPYHVDNLSKFLYISGSYWVAKKEFMIEHPLDERLLWGQGEDVKWSKEVREIIDFNMNPNSSVNIMKPGKDRVFHEMDDDKLNLILKEYESHS
jgi:hypothetical protein